MVREKKSEKYRIFWNIICCFFIIWNLLVQSDLYIAINIKQERHAQSAHIWIRAEQARYASMFIFIVHFSHNKVFVLFTCILHYFGMK